MKLLFNIISSFVIILFFQACTKVEVKVVEKPNQMLFSRTALGYVKLVPGKYLVYIDSATSAIDSVIVSESRLDTVSSPAGNPSWLWPAYQGERFNLVLNKVTPTGFLSPWFTGSDIADPTALLGYSFSDTALVNLREPVNGMSAFYFAHSQVNNGFISVEGKTYNNIVITTSTLGTINQPGYYQTIYYWAKPVGIIKRTIIRNGGQVTTSNLLKNN